MKQKLKINKAKAIFKCHGGKNYLATWILSKFPKNYISYNYLEPFAGGGNVLLSKPYSPVEHLNDIDANIIAIYKCVKDKYLEFQDRLTNTPYSLDVFEKALQYTYSSDEFENGINELILRRMSRGGLKKSFAWSDRERGGQPGDVNAWKNFIKNIPDIHDRIKSVEFSNFDALDLLKRSDFNGYILYVDPPYLHSTRQSKNDYDFEMMDKQHIELAETLKALKAKIIVSGYKSKLYDELYQGWTVHTKDIVNHASQQKFKSYKQEYLWCNY